MCGIIGYTGNRNAVEIITDGLRKLEYRGYDSAGLSVFENRNLVTLKTSGRVSALKGKSEELYKKEIFCGIGHTRWATHGRPDIINCHPHGTENVMIVHNGIIENYTQLKSLFPDDIFISETDTEVIAHILDDKYRKTKNPIKAIADTCRLLKGSYALGILFADYDDTVFAVRHDSPLLIGKGTDENCIASDTAAFSRDISSFIRLDDGNIAKIKKDSIYICDLNGKEISIPEEKISFADNAIKTDSDTPYMLKEIYETPEKMQKTFGSATKDFLPDFNENLTEILNGKTDSIHIIACGTALHAGLIGRYYIEKLARIPVKTDTAGEFRYGDPVISENDIAFIISQSGETADSLAALRMLKEKGIKTVAIVNSYGSSIAVEATEVIYTPAGKEMAVASTKAFNVQCQILLILAVKLALKRKTITESTAKRILISHTKAFSRDIPEILKNTSQFTYAADKLKESEHIFFIGRGADSYLSAEGSLKMKEITYIHSESFPASELKHGTISLIEKGTPVIAVATEKNLYDKLKNNIMEVKSRGAYIIAVCRENATEIKNIADICITIPDSDEFASTFSAATALQLLAFHTADALGRDIDKPRNLAKSVTVE